MHVLRAASCHKGGHPAVHCRPLARPAAHAINAYSSPGSRDGVEPASGLRLWSQAGGANCLRHHRQVAILRPAWPVLQLQLTQPDQRSLRSLPEPEGYSTFNRGELDGMNEVGQQQHDRLHDLGSGGNPQAVAQEQASGTAAQPTEQKPEEHRIYQPGQGWVALSGTHTLSAPVSSGLTSP